MLLIKYKWPTLRDGQNGFHYKFGGSENLVKNYKNKLIDYTVVYTIKNYREIHRIKE